MVNGYLETYNKLIESAKREFENKEYEKVSIRNIASGANLTIGALYQHFKNKEDLYDCIFSPICDGLYQ